MVAYVEQEGPGAFSAGSDRRLPFEPKGEMLAWRNQIRSAVQGLRVGRDELLHASYASADRSHCDVENVLFYNVGASPFRGVASGGLRFERSHRISPAAVARDVGHEAVYRASERTGGFLAWREGSILARLSPTPLRSLAPLSSATATWLTVVEGPLTAFGMADNRPLMVRLRLGVKAGRRVNCAAAVKPLLDGLLSALHVMPEGDFEPEIAVRLGARLGIPPERATALLTSADQAVLGHRAVLHLRGSSFQWNPADHLCTACEVLVEEADVNSLEATVSLAEATQPV